MNNSISQQMPKLNTGSTKNKRDTVYKMGPNATYSFYQLYDDIMLILKPISDYSNKLIVQREFEKVSSHCLTIINTFFMPALNRLLPQSKHAALAEEFINSLNTILKGFKLNEKAMVSVTQNPAPNDEDMTRYVNEFILYANRILPPDSGTDGHHTPTATSAPPVQFKKPHMLGMDIVPKEKKDKKINRLKALYQMTLLRVPSPYRSHTFSNVAESLRKLSLF